MDEDHRMRLRALLRGVGMQHWDIRSFEERCEGWWPSLSAFVAEEMSGSTAAPPAEMLASLEALGQSWIAEERIALLEDPGGGVFVIRVGGL